MTKQNHDCRATQGAQRKKPIPKQLDQNIDNALADPTRHRVINSYIAGEHRMTNYCVCNVVNGRCEVCGAEVFSTTEKSRSGCISVTRGEPIYPESRFSIAGSP